MARDAASIFAPVHPAPRRNRAGPLKLAFGAIGGPLAWGVRLVVNYALASHACFPADVPRDDASSGGLWPLLIAVDAAALLIAATAAIVSYSSWRSTREEFEGSAPEVIDIGEGRTHFLALWGMMTGLGFFLATVFDLVMLAGLRPCE
jgi:hypothetical protein